MNRAITERSALTVKSLTDPLDEVAAAKLCEFLPEHVAGQRWFRAKTKTISKIEVEDVLPLPDTQAYLLVLHLSYTGGETDRYILPVSVDFKALENREDMIARLIADGGKEGVLFNALADPVFRNVLLEAIVCSRSIKGRNGRLLASRTDALTETCGPVSVEHESFVSRAEQSNTSIIYRDRYILKLFRKLESGINPDLEIGRFLTEHRFRNTPAVLGAFEYHSNRYHEPFAVGILQQFVANQGDAWKYTLESLEDFFAKALASKRTPPPRITEHPLELIGVEIPSQVRTFIGTYLESAALLGKRTAEMHAALAEPTSGSDFAPEPFTPEHRDKLHHDLVKESAIAFDLLRRKYSSLSGDTAESARKLLNAEASVNQRFAAMQQQPVTAVRIRHHGDYHLGQVLATAGDFMIIDFEGEPARPLAERRLKSLALRDVAGMVRSFQYAAFAALFGQVPGVPSDPDSRHAVEQWAAAWNAYVSATYLQAYFEASQGQSFIPDDWPERRILLDAFLLQKALYELAYELNNRPDWLQIPLRGILSLLA